MDMIRLGIRTTPARLDQQGNGNWNLLDLRTEKPRIEMSSKLGELHIDQRECFAEVGFKGLTDFRVDNVDYGKTILARGIARIIDDGNQFIEIQNGVDAVVEQADYNAFGMFEKEFVYGVVPMSKPKITVDPATRNYNYIPGQVHLNLRDGKVQSTYYRGRVEYYTY